MIATRIRSSFSRRNLEFAGKIGFGAEVWILLRENRVAPTHRFFYQQTLEPACPVIFLAPGKLLPWATPPSLIIAGKSPSTWEFSSPGSQPEVAPLSMGTTTSCSQVAAAGDTQWEDFTSVDSIAWFENTPLLWFWWYPSPVSSNAAWKIPDLQTIFPMFFWTAPSTRTWFSH